MRGTRWSIALLVLLLLGACGQAPAASNAPGSAQTPAATLNVFAAASLTEVFDEIGRSFEAANAGVAITFNFAGSNQLAHQIAQGAPADVFASANEAQMSKAIESGHVNDGAQQAFARNRLVVITPLDNPADIRALSDLARPGVKLLLADKAAPVGQYSLDFLAKASKLPEYAEAYGPAVLDNVVSYEENVRAVLSKVALGEGDAGIVYTSDINGENADKVNRLVIPDDLNTIATYPIAPIKGSRNPDIARKFVDYVLSQEGQTILAKYGFIPVNV